MSPMLEEQAQLTADAVARRSYGKLIAFLSARTRNVAAAEDALSDAFASALADWPRHGCPDNPEAWLLTAARRRLIDTARRRDTSDAAVPQLQLLAEELEAASEHTEIPDRRLALMFACAHPAIDAELRAPLMLQIVVGLDAKTIASAFLISPAAMSKRLVRAKTKIHDAGIPFRIPEREELAPRLDAVLTSIYATFSEGWTDPGGTDIARRDLTEEAFFLARLIVELLPAEPEPLGLLALMLYAEARRSARRSTDGAYIPLAGQDTAQWNARMIHEAETILHRARTHRIIGRYQIEAAIQSAHTARHCSGHNNWPNIIELYDALAVISCSPVVAINRALAISETEGPRAGLDAMPRLADDPRLNQYQPFWAARAELLSRIGACNKAREAYDMAIGLERDPAVRSFLQRRLATLPGSSPDSSSSLAPRDTKTVSS
jgi:RNA polymerase sigma-70 factor (ECF subfamily)